MMFSSEFRASIQVRVKPVRKANRLSITCLRTPADPDDDIDPDDRSQVDVIKVRVNLSPLALPPPEPSWRFLCERAGTSVSCALAAGVLESVGCYLAIRPLSYALTQANRCRSAGDLRQLIVETYGQQGLDTAYQMGGLRPPLPVERLQSKQASLNVETADRLVSHHGFTSQARILRWFDCREPVSPAWRSSLPPAGKDDGAWVG